MSIYHYSLKKNHGSVGIKLCVYQKQIVKDENIYLSDSGLNAS
jgi:hypothetical protein